MNTVIRPTVKTIVGKVKARLLHISTGLVKLRQKGIYVVRIKHHATD